jgi:uncharacterized SAM-binding protein YcdF (DUF218 family)
MAPGVIRDKPRRRHRAVDSGASLRMRRTLAAAMFLTTFVVLASLVFRTAGSWLVVADALQPARAVVVFGGHVPFRAMEAAAIYKQGWAREIWLTQSGVYGEDLALERLGIERPPEHVYSRLVLERLGVRSDAIHLLAERNRNTADEVRAVARELKADGGTRVILITSKYHARRVKVIWHTLVGSRPEAIVRYAAEDPFEPNRWWRNTADAMSVSREWFGLLNAWAGFPVKSERW